MKQTVLILISAALALVAKLYCAATTVGTNDAVFFYGFGKLINRVGLERTYQLQSIFNHTPLVGTYAALLQRTEPGTQLKPQRYPFFLRLPGIIGDFLSVLILLRIRKLTGSPPGWAILIFALSPVAFMVSGFHGNVDSLLAMLILAAAWLALEDKPLLCAVALGLACNVKVSPLLLTPVFFFWWRSRPGWRLFFYPTTAIILAGWSPALINPDTRNAFLTNVLGYQGYWGIWGISYWLRETGAEDFAKIGFEELTGAQKSIMSVTKFFIIASTLAVAWRRRKVDGVGLFHTLAWVWAVFFVFATGVAPQYFVWIAPFLVVALPRWSALVTGAASVFLFVFYNVTSNVRTNDLHVIGGDPWAMPWSHPWNMAVSKGPHIQLWGPWQTLPWLVLIGCLVVLSIQQWKEYRNPRT